MLLLADLIFQVSHVINYDLTYEDYTTVSAELAELAKPERL